MLRRRTTAAGRLFAQELRELTTALDYFVDVLVRPRRKALTDIVAELLPGASDADLDESVDMVIALALLCDQGAPVLKCLGRSVPRGRDGVAVLAESIIRFALAGLKAIR